MALADQGNKTDIYLNISKSSQESRKLIYRIAEVVSIWLEQKYKF